MVQWIGTLHFRAGMPPDPKTKGMDQSLQFEDDGKDCDGRYQQDQLVEHALHPLFKYGIIRLQDGG